MNNYEYLKFSTNMQKKHDELTQFRSKEREKELERQKIKDLNNMIDFFINRKKELEDLMMKKREKLKDTTRIKILITKIKGLPKDILRYNICSFFQINKPAFQIYSLNNQYETKLQDSLIQLWKDNYYGKKKIYELNFYFFLKNNYFNIIYKVDWNYQYYFIITLDRKENKIFKFLGFKLIKPTNLIYEYSMYLKKTEWFSNIRKMSKYDLLKLIKEEGENIK